MECFRFYRISYFKKEKDFLKEGEVFFGYIIWYSFGRFFIEGMRTDSLYAFGSIRVSQLVSLVLFFGAIASVIIRRKKGSLKFYDREKGTLKKAD